MSQHQASFAHLQALLDQVPAHTLRAGQVAGDKPGLLAGDAPVCRLREGTEGAAYGALIIGAVNALPGLLKALQEPAEAAGAAIVQANEDDPLRQQIESTITQTLHLLPGFKVGASATWAKLIYAAVEPWLSGGREVLAAAPAPVTQHQQPQNVDGQQQARLDAVMDFCTYMLAKDDSETRPNEYALEQLVNDWDKAHNGAQSDHGKQGGGQ